MVDLREAAGAADVAQDPARGLGGPAQRHAAGGREVVDRAGAVVDVAAGDLVVRVPAVGDDLRGARDQVAAGLVAPDLAPGGVRDVVGQRDEVELALAERVAEGLAHRRVAERRVLGVDVQVARVPARLLALRLGASTGSCGRGGRRTRAPSSTRPRPARRRGRRRPRARGRRSRPARARRTSGRAGSPRAGSRAWSCPARAPWAWRGTPPRSRSPRARASRPGGWSRPSRGTRARRAAGRRRAAARRSRGRACGGRSGSAPRAGRSSTSRARPSCRPGRRTGRARSRPAGSTRSCRS